MADLISHRDQVTNLLATYRTKDPRLVQILETLMDDLHETIITVNPIKDAVAASGISDTTPPATPSVITVTLLPFNIQLAWGSVTNAQLYEIQQGTVWESATFILKTSSLAASLNPLSTGSHNYLIKAISVSGIYSLLPLAFQIVVPSIGSVVVTSSVIDNNVLIYWTIPTSAFFIDHYNIYKGGVKFAEIKSNFISRFEVVSGIYTYGVEAVDIAGNVGSRGNTSATVRQPPDYDLLESRDIDFTIGTRINCFIENGKLIACADLTETFQDHFISKSWVDPEDQVTAGFDRYIQENLLTGSYEEDHDYGAVLNNIIVNYQYLKEIFLGTSDVTIVIKTYYKVLPTDAWTGPLTGSSVFIPSFRYLRTRMEFTATNNDSMIAISSFSVKLDVKKGVDSGYVSALASDTLGTVVNFNRTFLDIDGIECTSKSISPITVIVDFVDIPYPTSFKVLCYDSGGRRVDQFVYWIARGII